MLILIVLHPTPFVPHNYAMFQPYIPSVKKELLTPQFFSQRSLDLQRGALAQMGGDLDKLQFTGVDAVPTQPVSSAAELVRTRRKSLNRRCLHLRDEVGPHA